MPIFEYTCDDCGHEFEFLLRGSRTPACPSCQSVHLKKKLSLHGVQGDSAKAKGLRAAKKRDKSQATDRMHDRLNYEESHDRHGH